MYSSSFRRVSVIVLTTLLAALVLVIGLAIRDNPASALPQPATGTPLAEPATGTTLDAAVIDAAVPTAPSEPALGDSFRLPRGGFTLQMPPGYTLDISGDTALLRAEGGLATGTVIRLQGGSRSRFALESEQEDETLEALFNRLADLYAAEKSLAVGSPEPLTIAGADGLAAPLLGEAAEGRFVVAQPAPDQLFTLAADGPQDAWESQGAADVQRLIDTVGFFAPEQPATGIAEAVSASESATTTPQATPARPGIQPASTPTSAQDAQAGPEGSAQPTPIPVATATATAIAPVATPDAGRDLPGRTPTVQVYSNGNFVNNVAVMRSTIWAATGGGVVAWNKSSGGHVKFTVMDGLMANRTVAAAVCPLPGFGVLFAGDLGIQVFDTQNGRWRTLDSSNSAMRYDEVSTLWCDPERGVLVVGYARQGLDLYDANSETWTYVGPDEGLAISGVRTLDVAGDEAPIWLATDEGLAAYAAGEVTLYTTENSPLLDNRIETLSVDGSGTVWLATGNTLYRTDGEEWSAFNAEGAGQANFPAGRITGLDVGSDGAIWIGSDLAQICRFDPGIEGCIEFYSGEEGMATEPVTSLTIGPEGEVYYTTAGGGISAFDGSAWRSLVIENEVVPGNAIQALIQDDEGAVWIGAAGGAARVSPDDEAGAQLLTPANSPLPSSNVRVVRPVGPGAIWFGTEGASFYDGAAWTHYTVEDGLAGSPIQAITGDNQDRTWIGTQTGLSIWTGSTFFNLTTANGLPSDDISALLADGNVIWIGTRGGGLLRFQDNQLQVFNRENIRLPSNNVSALAQTEDGVLWIGTDAGLARFADNSMTPVEPLQSAAIVGLVVGPDGVIWAAGGENALYYLDGNADGDSASETWTPFALSLQPGPQISALLVDAAGDLWVGYAQGGLARYTP